MGASREGYCKICSSPYAAAVNKLIVDGKNAAEVGRQVSNLGLTFTRHTFYKHKDDHVTHPLITAVKRAQRNPLVVPKSNHGALEMIRELGMRKAVDNPEEVTIDHALKAAQILQASEKKGDNILVVLAKAVMAEPPDDIAGLIEGEYEEVKD